MMRCECRAPAGNGPRGRTRSVAAHVPCLAYVRAAWGQTAWRYLSVGAAVPETEFYAPANRVVVSAKIGPVALQVGKRRGRIRCADWASSLDALRCGEALLCGED